MSIQRLANDLGQELIELQPPTANLSVVSMTDSHLIRPTSRSCPHTLHRHKKDKICSVAPTPRAFVKVVFGAIEAGSKTAPRVVLPAVVLLSSK